MVFIRISFVLVLVSCLGLAGQAQLKIGPTVGANITSIQVDYASFPNREWEKITNSNKLMYEFGIVAKYNFGLNRNYALKLRSYYSDREYKMYVHSVSGGMPLYYNQLSSSVGLAFIPFKPIEIEVGVDHIFVDEFRGDNPNAATDKYGINRNDIGILTGMAYQIYNIELAIHYRLGIWYNTRTLETAELDIFKSFDFIRLSCAYLFNVNFKKGKKEECPEH